MRSISKVAFLILLFTGCGPKVKVPKNVLKPEEMKAVVWDVFLAEGWARKWSTDDSTVNLANKFKELSEAALKKHNLTEKDFFVSYEWYVNNPGVFNPMLDSLYAQESRPEVPDEDIMPDKPDKKRKFKAIKDSLKLMPIEEEDIEDIEE